MIAKRMREAMNLQIKHEFESYYILMGSQNSLHCFTS
jgi:ferritin